MAGSIDPSVPSSAYETMLPGLAMVQAVLDGARAVREAGVIYLPQYDAESTAEYARRKMSAPWRPEFADVLRSLGAKPFSREIAIQGETSDQVRDFAEDVDTLGHNLHTFAKVVFDKAVAFGFHGILVDYPAMNPEATRADEIAAGARPYWVHVPARNLIAVYTETVAGRARVTHARFREFVTRRVGFAEQVVERVRVFEPGIWQLWEKAEDGSFQLAGEGETGLADVPLVLFVTGERDGDVIRPPLIDLADMQMELYRALSRQEEVLTFAGSPMLCASGMQPPMPERDADGVIIPGGTIQVGPKRVLFAPPSEGSGTPEWRFIQPDARNIEQVAKHVGSIIEDMKRLGMQPLMPRTGTITATATGVEAAKAHSTVQAWAMGLKDALEQALVFTSQWLGETASAEVFVNTDFGLGIHAELDLTELREAYKVGLISRETYWDELARRGKLGPQFDPAAETVRLAAAPVAQPAAPIPPA